MACNNNNEVITLRKSEEEAVHGMLFSYYQYLMSVNVCGIEPLEIVRDKWINGK